MGNVQEAAQLRLLPDLINQEALEESQYVRERAAILALKERAKQDRARIRRIGESLYRSSKGIQLDLIPEDGIVLGEITEQEVYTMHEEILLHSLHLLKDNRTTRARKRDILSWIAAPIVRDCGFKDHSFSFQLCAVACGCDPERLQDAILINIVPKLGIGQ